METGKLKTLLLEIHMFILWTVPLCLQGQSPEHVVDLLAALNMSQPIKGISKIHSEDPSGTTTAYKLRTKAPHLTLPPEYSHLLVSTRQGSVGVHLVGRNPFSGARWVRLALGLEPEKVSLFVDCEEAVVVQRKREEERMDLSFELPEDLAVTLASTAGDNDSKFSGYLKTAEISMRAYGRRPWHCPNITEEPPLPHHTHLPRLDSLDDKGQQELQKDQPQRGVALGPPGHPQGVRSASPTAQEEERLSGLEQRLEQMVVMLDMVKAQNADLQARVRYLEGCDCVMRRRCTWEGSQVEEGHRWQTHSNTVCSCSSGQVTCEANIVANSVSRVQPTSFRNESQHKEVTVLPGQSVEGDCNEDSHFLYTRKYLSRPRCQALVKDLPGGAAVVSFSPGEKCSELGCGEGCGCLSRQQQNHHWQYSRRLKRG
ncbi:hypothetical protein NHX12_002530 [Muraenolepis orangiensis]|uniref:Uncharacterized protein n=1 Tax=Muraenolepis orangiensis TaxID=630683 RepID=A0A9Q0DX25_9TELE|nr:hypothetical protein NHX12_002530 [Muraenolepis orangiensis]